MCSVESNLSNVKVASKRKLNILNLSDKVSLILEVEKSPHIKKNILAKKYGIPGSTLSTILKNKTIILDRFASNVNPNCKKLKSCAFPQIESALIAWCQTYQMEHGNFPTSGILLQEKAIDLANLMGVKEFKASAGWLERFKGRYKAALRTLNGDTKDQTDDSQISEEESLERLLKSYDTDNIFSIDETTLFFKYFQSKIKTEGESLSEDKQNMDKLTIVIGANASGTEKLPLVVIAKAKIQLSSDDGKFLPVEYYTNRKALLTYDLFESYIRKLDHVFHLRQRKILLFVGNCRSHFEVPNLKAIKLETLPIISSPLLQSSDQHIVKCIKQVYQEHLARLTNESDAIGINYNIDLLQAIKILSRIWDNDISQSIIINSFKNQGIFKNQQVYNYENLASADELSVNESEILNTSSSNSEESIVASSSNSVDESIVASNSNSIDKFLVVNEISHKNASTFETKDNESAEDICVLAESPSDSEVIMAIDTIKRYLKSRSKVKEELLGHLQKISDFVSVQQTTLIDQL